MGRLNYNGSGERIREVTLQKKKKRRNYGFPSVFDVREMRRTRETKVTQRMGTWWHIRQICGHGVGGRRACSELGEWR